MYRKPFFLLSPGPMEAKQWSNFEQIQGVDEIKISRTDYTFSGFVGKEDALLQLEHLLGPGCAHGGCILVTGSRGSGKTTLVNRAIYEAGLLGRYGTDGDEDDPFRSLRYQLDRGGLVNLHIKDNDPRLVIEVRVNISSPITADALIRRLVRSFYWSLVEAGIAGLIPELMETARLACIRTVGEIDLEFEEWLKKTQQATVGLKITSKDGLEAQIGASAQAELQIARKMAIHLGVSQREELEEVLLRLFDDLQGTTLNVKPSIWHRIGRVASWAKGAWDSIRETILGGAGLRVSLVVVFDELDKLDWSDEDIASPQNNKNNYQRSQDESPNMVELGPHTIGLLTETREQMAPLFRKTNDGLRNVHSIAGALKPILTNGQVTFIFVGGTEIAYRWRTEKGRRDAILPSIFTDHVHTGLLDASDIDTLLKNNVDGWESVESDQKKKCIVYGLLYQSAGILKNVLLELRSLATRNKQARGTINATTLMALAEDATFCQNAKKAFAVE